MGVREMRDERHRHCRVCHRGKHRGACLPPKFDPGTGNVIEWISVGCEANKNAERQGGEMAA